MNKISLYLVNGALGAGKTTVVDFLLRQPLFTGARVVENEFASVSIDTETLAERVEEVATIAGACVCCSSGDELIGILDDFATKGNAPVIIESTGVANTLRLVEKLVIGGVLERYELAQSLYVLDGLETDINQLSVESLTEARAADVVLVSKVDMLPKARRDAVFEHLKLLGINNAYTANYGTFDLNVLSEESQILDYLAACAEVGMASQELNYTVIDVANVNLAPSQLETLWFKLCQKYGLRRLKGSFVDNNKQYHIEATPRQCVVNTAVGGTAKLVFIGERARELTGARFKELLRA